MSIMTANDARTRFGEFLGRAQRGPVRVTKHNRVVGVLLSNEDYEAMRRYYATRLQDAMRDATPAAEASGLTQERLDSLLEDDCRRRSRTARRPERGTRG